MTSALLQNDAQILKEPVETLHSCSVTFPLPFSHAVISGQHYLRKSRALQKHTQSLLSSPPAKQTQAEIPKSPCPRQTHSIFFSEEVRESESLKEARGSPVWVTSVINSSLCSMLKADLWYMIPKMRHYILFDCWLTRQEVVVVADKRAKGNYKFCIMLSKHYIHTFILQSIIPILFILSPKPLVLYRLEPISISGQRQTHIQIQSTNSPVPHIFGLLGNQTLRRNPCQHGDSMWTPPG